MQTSSVLWLNCTERNKCMQQAQLRRFYVRLIATGMALCLSLLAVAGASANSVNIYDQANVLNADQVRSAASSLPNPINIYTTNTFTGDTSAFEHQATTHLTNPNLLVMAIDTNSAHHHVAIVGGSDVSLSQSQYDSATQAFVQAYQSNKGDYTTSTIASLQSLRSSLGAAPVNPANPNNGSVPVPTTNSGGLFSSMLGTTCCIGGAIVLLGLGLLFTLGRRRFFGRRPQGIPPYQQPYPPDYGPNYNQPYNQPYPPNYGPNYNQGPGMNPWAAGGLGAAAGGLLGYELGKDRGEDEARAQYDDNNPGNNYGNGGDFGGGGGGSAADFGNGGDFGGGSGADFGGGGDAGGGGSSSNF
jgi:hypothetical protein